jgi:hypothetical protein
MQGLDAEFSFPMFAADGSNWAIYRDQVAQILGQRSLHLTNAEMPSSYPTNEAADDATRRWEREDAVVKYSIACSLPDSVFSQIKQCPTAKDVWDKLKQTFDDAGRWPKIYLQRELYNQKCGESEDVRAHFARLDDLRERLAGWGKTVPDDEYAYILLASLRDVYGTTVSAISIAARFLEKDPHPSDVVHLVTNEYDQRKLQSREARRTTQNRGSSAAARRRKRKP